MSSDFSQSESITVESLTLSDQQDQPIKDTESTTVTEPEEAKQAEGDDEEEEEEEEGECGFCIFMKSGGCREMFVGWEKCIEEAEKNNEDIVEKCFKATSALKKCMEANEDYYAPILMAEKRAEEELGKENEKEEVVVVVIVDSEKKIKLNWFGPFVRAD